MSENTLKPCPFCNEAERRGFINGQNSMLEHAVRQAELSTRPIIIEDTRPTPSSALTKALEEALKRIEHLREDLIPEADLRSMEEAYHVRKQIENATEALRASPGGEGSES